MKLLSNEEAIKSVYGQTKMEYKNELHMCFRHNKTLLLFWMCFMSVVFDSNFQVYNLSDFLSHCK